MCVRESESERAHTSASVFKVTTYIIKNWFSFLGVWATKPILKGKKFGPFVGDKKKRSQVKNNVYMWEVRKNFGFLFIRVLYI